jgi:FkbH-like protein
MTYFTMRLAEALQIAGQPAGERDKQVHLLTGFSPLHLASFVKAYLRLRFPEDGIRLHTGLYGDLEGNLQRAREIATQGALAVIEWSDLDQRLSLRSSSGWSAPTLDDIVTQAEERCSRLQPAMEALAGKMPLTIVSATLPLPPVTHLPPAQTSSFELNLQAILAGFLQRISTLPGVRLLSASLLDLQSPHSTRHDVKADLLHGFPYSLAHADTLARLSVDCLFPAAPRKGLITDLDQTLWKGILGEDGVDGISWSLESKSQAHALYQQMLASLAEAGVLVAIASKNDPALVAAALERPDLLIRAPQIFPIEAGWGAKSEAVARILQAWNIGAESVIFLDDSPMELAEVAEKFPAMECMQFPASDPAAVFALLQKLRTSFGKNEVRQEDRLRLQSLRAAGKLEQEKQQAGSPDFLSRLNARLTFEASGSDPRAFELVNKTNQFNLNGRRYTEAEWKARQQRPGAFLTTVSYEDRFGPLGRIAVMGGCMANKRCLVDLWVMSCRAFSRHIEFQMLRQLFSKSGAPEVLFDFQPTERNRTLQDFFRHFIPDFIPQSKLKLSADVFEKLCPPLFQQVTEK